MDLKVFKYNSNSCSVHTYEAQQCLKLAHEPDCYYWYDFDGKPDVDLFVDFVKKLLPDFSGNVQRLFLSDLSQFAENKEWVSLSLKMMEYDAQQNKISYESITMILVGNVVISVQGDVEGDHFNEVRERLQTPNSNLSQKNAEYLFVRLLESIENNYHKIIDEVNTELLEIEGFIPNANNISELRTLFKIKRELMFLRKNISPLREILYQMMNSEEYSFSKLNSKLLKSVYERLIFVVDSIDLDREMLSGMLDFHISSNGYKMNNVMKVLTIISTIFMPLGFLAGYYGMNFSHMPYLSHPDGFWYMSAFMLAVAMVMLMFFVKKKWL